MKVINSITPTAPKLIIYGNPGVGKSTLAAQMSKPLFLDFEGGLNYLEVARTPQIINLDEFYSYLIELARTKEREYDTILIDSADWLTRKIVEKAAGITAGGSMAEIDKAMENTLNRAGGGYGNGNQLLENHIRAKLLPMLVKLNTLGYGIVLIAHAYSKTLLDDDGVEVEKVMPKIDPPTVSKPIAAPAFIEWVDNVFYLKKQGGSRKVLFESDPTALAKNRLGLTGESDVDKLNLTDLLTKSKKEKK